MFRTMVWFVLGMASMSLATPAEEMEFSAGVAPNVAIIYSGFGKGQYGAEFDPAFKSLGWSAQKFKNTELSKLITRLDQFDFIISTTVANLDQPQDLGRWKAEWLKFLNRGGLIFIVDVDRDSVRKMWVNTLGPGFNLDAPPNRDFNPTGKVVISTDWPLLTCPNNIRSGFLRMDVRANLNFQIQKAGWQDLVVNAGGKGTFLVRKVGKGTLAVTSYAFFDFPWKKELSKNLLENLWLCHWGRRQGLVVTQFTPGPMVPGPQQTLVVLYNLKDAEQSMDVSLYQDVKSNILEKVARKTVTVLPKRTAEVALPYAVTKRGAMTVGVTVKTGEGRTAGWRTSLSVPPLLTVQLADVHVFPLDPKVRLSIRFVPDSGVALEKCRGVASIDGKTVSPVTFKTTSADLTLDVADLKIGKHQLVLTVVAEGKELGRAGAEFYTHAMPLVYSRPDGVMMVKGKPVFPFGFYHVPGGQVDRTTVLREIAAAGYNTLHARINTGEDAAKELLDEADRRGVYVIGEFESPASRDGIIERYKNHPAILAWNPGDEPDLNMTGELPSEIAKSRERSDAAKIVDPGHPTYTVLVSSETFDLFANCADIIAHDCYPIPDGLPYVYRDMTSLKKERARYGRGCWGVLQCFGYPPEVGPPLRLPTFRQIRNMTYQALLAGVKGIIYYTYSDFAFNLKAHPGLWADMKTMPGEIKALEPALLNGKLTTLKTGQDEVIAGMGEIGPRRIVCIVNMSDQKKPANVILPDNSYLRIKPLFAGRPSGCVLNKGTIAGTLGGQDVHVYEMEK